MQSIPTSSARVQYTKMKMCRSFSSLWPKEESSALLKMKDYLTEAARQLLLQEAGIVSLIGASHVLAIKEGLAIPWTKLTSSVITGDVERLVHIW